MKTVTDPCSTSLLDLSTPPALPPTALVGRDTAAESLRFYATRFVEGRLGRCDRHDLVAHLLNDAAAEIERLRDSLDGLKACFAVGKMQNAALKEEIQRLEKKVGDV